MPRLWTDTIEAHRRDVRDAILATTAELVSKRGLRSVTMSQIADETGIGRSTLYKYFPDVEAILHEWHQRQISAHLEHLEEVHDGVADPVMRLPAVLEAYALMLHASRGHTDPDLAAFLHRDDQVMTAERKLRGLLRALLRERVEAGYVRHDVPLDELATYFLHALAAAKDLTSKNAVRRLVELTLAGLTRAEPEG